MSKRFPEKDLPTELLHDVPWNDIANKIGFMHGKYLHTFWESNVKYTDEDGKIRFKKPGKLPVKVSCAFNEDQYSLSRWTACMYMSHA